jgi:acyl-CoA synthetase (AMP-forming)/AMP-acid ligase II
MTRQALTMDTALSVSAAAAECPDALAVRTDSGDITYRELDRLVRAKRARLVRPAPGRPYLLDAVCELETFLTVYALWEEGIPVLLMQPGMTAAERSMLLADIDAIKEPLPADTAVVIFTSGTTGRPKPAMLSRSALIASARSNARNLTLGPGDIWLMSISCARIGGLSILSRSLLARSAIATARHFTPETFIKTLRDKQVTLASIVPTMLVKALDAAPDWGPPPSLRSILVGGASASDALLKRARQRGFPIMTTYGMTETASNVVTTPYEERFEGAVGSGKCNADTAIKIIDGSIWVKGPMTMSGYWGHSSHPVDAWFETGDIGRFDENGYLHVEARRSDLIVSGGNNVYPVEVENALEEIEGIEHALVVGLPDDTWGAIVTALLVASDDTPVDKYTLIAALRTRLSGYKCPRRIAWVKELPLRPGGKPDRRPEVLNGMDLITLHYCA